MRLRKKNEKARVHELELNKKVSQLEAELGAAMDGLRAARLETEELKSASSEKKNADFRTYSSDLRRAHRQQ